MVVDLTDNMIYAIQVAFAELETDEWILYVTDEQYDQVIKGQAALEEIFRENNKD